MFFISFKLMWCFCKVVFIFLEFLFNNERFIWGNLVIKLVSKGGSIYWEMVVLVFNFKLFIYLLCSKCILYFNCL